MFYQMITDAAQEPVTLAVMKSYMRLETPSSGADLDAEVTADNTLIDTFIKSAREYIEKETGQVFLTQTWVAIFDQWPVNTPNNEWWDGERLGSIIGEMPRSFPIDKTPLQSVEYIQTSHPEDITVNFPQENYYVDSIKNPPEIRLREGVSWPTPGVAQGGIKIQFKLGYGDSPDNTPSALRHALMMLVNHWYENRDVVNLDGSMMVPMGFNNLLDKYKRLRLIT